MNEVEEQEEATRKYEGVIAALEPFIIQSQDGQFSFGEVDFDALDADRDALQSLKDSVDDINASLVSGVVALNDIQTSTPGIGNG